MKVQIYQDEWYPILMFRTEEDSILNGGEIVEVPDNVIETYSKAYVMFVAAQKMLREHFNG